MPQRRAEREVCSHLLRAIWAGELIVRRTPYGEPMQVRELLQIVFLAKSHPGFDISGTGVSQDSSSEEQPDGGVVISFHGHIALPENSSDWTDQAVGDAINVLRHQPFDAFGQHVRVLVYSLLVHRDYF